MTGSGSGSRRLRWRTIGETPTIVIHGGSRSPGGSGTSRTRLPRGSSPAKYSDAKRWLTMAVAPPGGAIRVVKRAAARQAQPERLEIAGADSHARHLRPLARGRLASLDRQPHGRAAAHWGLAGGGGAAYRAQLAEALVEPGERKPRAARVFGTAVPAATRSPSAGARFRYRGRVGTAPGNCGSSARRRPAAPASGRVRRRPAHSSSDARARLRPAQRL